MYFLLKQSLFRCYVSFREGSDLIFGWLQQASRNISPKNNCSGCCLSLSSDKQTMAIVPFQLRIPEIGSIRDLHQQIQKNEFTPLTSTILFCLGPIQSTAMGGSGGNFVLRSLGPSYRCSVILSIVKKCRAIDANF